ncbi:MAG: EVE domain-containing protein [Ignavibacteria bacterium]
MVNKLLSNAERIWIFQCNPEKYKIRDALLDKNVINCFHWKVKQHKDEILSGHIGLIWCSGSSSGIYAITELISNPGEFIETENEKKYWVDDTDEKGSQYRVKMKLIKHFINTPIKRETILKINGLQNLSIIKMPRGTNFLVNKEEWALINKLIEN